MPDISLNKRSFADMDAFASNLGDSALQERSDELRSLVGSSGLQSAPTPEQSLLSNIKKAWVPIYGAQVNQWPQILQDSLATIEAGIGFANFKQNVIASFQNLRLYEDVRAFEAGAAVVRGFSPSPLVGEGWGEGVIETNTGLIPESAARAGLSFISSPFTLIAPIWAGGIAGRTVTGLTANAGRALSLADEAIVGAATFFGLIGESAAFVATGDMIHSVNSVWEGLRPLPAWAATEDRPYEKSFLQETFASALFFGMLKASGAAGRFVAGMMPRGETGLALAKLTGHAASISGLALSEEVQEAAGIAPATSTTLHERFWRAFFLHTTINAVNGVMNLEGVQSEYEKIRATAQTIKSMLEAGFAPELVAAMAGRSGANGDMLKTILNMAMDGRRPTSTDEEVVSTLCELAASGDEAALSTLAEKAKTDLDAVHALCALVEDGNKKAASILRNLDVTALVEMMSKIDWKVVPGLYVLIESRNKTGLPTLAEEAETDKEVVSTLRELASSGNEAALSALAELAKTNLDAVRALRALVKDGNKTAASILRKLDVTALENIYYILRDLANVGNKAALSALAKQAKTSAYAASALHEVAIKGNKSAASALRKLDVAVLAGQAKTDKGVVSVLHDFAFIGNKSAASALRKLDVAVLAEQAKTSVDAVLVLRELAMAENKSAVSALERLDITALDDININILGVLANVGNKAALSALAKQAKTSMNAVSTLRNLAAIGDKSAASVLRTLDVAVLAEKAKTSEAGEIFALCELAAIGNKSAAPVLRTLDVAVLAEQTKTSDVEEIVALCELAAIGNKSAESALKRLGFTALDTIYILRNNANVGNRAALFALTEQAKTNMDAAFALRELTMAGNKFATSALRTPDSTEDGVASNDNDMTELERLDLQSQLYGGGEHILPLLKSGDNVLDIGAGSGFIVLQMAEKVGPEGRVVGIDIDPASVAYANSKAAGLPNVEFKEASAMELPFPDATFDHVYTRFVIQRVPDPIAALKEARRVLKPGGKLVVVVGAEDTFGYSPPSDRFNALWGKFVKQVALTGRDPLPGKNLQGMLREAGFEDPSVELQRYTVTKKDNPGDFNTYTDNNARIVPMIGKKLMSDQTSAENMVTEAEIRSAVEELQGICIDPNAVYSERIGVGIATKPLDTARPDNTEKSLSVGARPAVSIPAEVMTDIRGLIGTKDADKLETYLRGLEPDMLWAIYAEIYDDMQNSLSVGRRLVDLHDRYARGNDVLDIGGGTGLNTERFVARGLNVVAVEPNANMRALMEAKVSGAQNLRIIPSFFEKAELEAEAFDTVSTRNVIYLVDDPVAFLERAFVVTRPGGRILISSILPSYLEALKDLKEMHRREIEESGKADELAWKISLVDVLSKIFLQNATIHRYTTTEMTEMLKKAGYTDIVFEEDPKNLKDYFFFIAAERPIDTVQAIPSTYEVERGNVSSWLAFLKSVPLDMNDIVHTIEELIRKTDTLLNAKGPSREVAEAFAEEGKSHLELLRTFIQSTSKAIERGKGWTRKNPLLEGFAPNGHLVMGFDSVGRAYINEAGILKLTGDKTGAAAARGKFGSLCLEAAEMLVKWLKAGLDDHKMVIDGNEPVYTFDGRTLPSIVEAYEMIKSTFEMAEKAFDEQLKLLKDAGADESTVKEARNSRRNAAIKHAEMFELGEDIFVKVGRGFMIANGTFTLIEALKMFSNAKVMLDQAQKLYSENDHADGEQRAQRSLVKIGNRIVQALESLESRIPASAISPEDFGYSPAAQGEFVKVDGFVDMMLEKLASTLTLLDGIKERWKMGENPIFAGVLPKIASIRRKIRNLLYSSQ